MAHNGKREFAISGTEKDVLSRGRNTHSYILNKTGLAKKVKTKINRRFRRTAKQEIRLQLI